MLDVLESWTRVAASGKSIGQTGWHAVETMSAARDVIAARTPLIGVAMAFPMEGDHEELGRMMPEKIVAFSEAGLATMSVWRTAHSTWMKHMAEIGAMYGRFPTLLDLTEFSDTMLTMSVESIEASACLGATALAPIHREATANARRLSKQGRGAATLDVRPPSKAN